MNKDEIKTVLELHVKWLANKLTGTRADLGGANLFCADLCCANLRCADLGGANLCCADLRDTDLRGANLCCADLGGANLCCADLRDTDLCCADLRGALGILRAECAWTDHGECGRNLLCVLIDSTPRYFCGCFAGTELELRAYISNGAEELKASRTIALDFCAARMAEMIAKRA